MRREPLVLLTLVVVGIVATGIAPAKRRAWLLELAPIFVGVPVLVRTRRRFPMTPLAYRLAFLLSVLLILGGFYTYSQVPWGFWLERSLRLTTFCGAVVSLRVLRARHEREMRALSLPGANRLDPPRVSPREGA